MFLNDFLMKVQSMKKMLVIFVQWVRNLLILNKGYIFQNLPRVIMWPKSTNTLWDFLKKDATGSSTDNFHPPE